MRIMACMHACMHASMHAYYGMHAMLAREYNTPAMQALFSMASPFRR